MAWIAAESDFDPDKFDYDVIGIASELNHHDSGPHEHNMGQLLFSQQGCMRITLNESICLLPPARIAWIPAHVIHRVQIRGAVGYRSVYLKQHRYTELTSHVEVISTTPLLREALERIAFAGFQTNWECGPASNILAVCLDELQSARRELTFLPLPRDRRLRCLRNIDPPPPLHTLAGFSGASEKTISRIMTRETGLNYQQWRQQWRLFRAVELLAESCSQSDVATALEFSSCSAFATFFRNMTGESPKSYMALRK